jgi:hypothetical protein
MTPLAGRRSIEGGQLYYGRHLVLLACAAAMLIVANPLPRWSGLFLSFALYGALHASTLVLALRSPQSMAQSAMFIGIAAGLSAFAALLGFYGARFVGVFPGMMGAALLLALASSLGAASYGLTLRLFWMPDFSRRAIATTALGCALVTSVILITGIYSQTIGKLWFVLLWWFAFSGGLWYHHGRKRA